MNLQLPNEGAKAPTASGILLVCVLSVAAPLTHWGNFTWEGLTLLAGGVALALYLQLRPGAVRMPPQHVLLGMLLAFLAVICCLTNGTSEVRFRYRLLGFSHDIYELNPYGRAIKIIAAGALLAAFTYLIERINSDRRLARGRSCVLVAAAVAMRVLMLYSSPAPACDVFQIETDGARKFIQEHRNFYTLEFKRPEMELGAASKYYGLAYPPTALYVSTASWWLFNDVRGGWIACDLLAALMIFLVARRMSPGQRRFHELAAVAFLFLPRSLYVLENGWVEPLMAAAMGGLALALASGRGPPLTGLLMGLWLTSKQYVVLGLPLLVRLRRVSIAGWLWAVAGGLALTLPFILWDFGALVDKTLVFFIESPGRADSLSVYGAMARHGLELPGWVSVGIWLLAVAWMTWKMPRTLGGWLFSTAAAWLVFFLVGKQAFINYYYFISFTLLLAAAATPLERSEAAPADAVAEHPGERGDARATQADNGEKGRQCQG